ncbi:hypothetical protein BDF22DRAFT_457545 [Syncephalis plumigaleata]|nr:hypothetical protein BDF22DRAFT_457545 [Syncephalis plumigaleata]
MYEQVCYDQTTRRNQPFSFALSIPECQYEITEKHVQSLLTAKDYDLWKRKKEESNMNGKMYCPNKRCSKVLTISHLSRANDCLAECIHCHYAICTKCTCLWHNGRIVILDVEHTDINYYYCYDDDNRLFVCSV